jgi:hypothetical protein
MRTRLILDANGNPFHLPGTQIYEEPDGTLTYDCPHCKPQPVPKQMVRHMAKYPKKRAPRHRPNI